MPQITYASPVTLTSTGLNSLASSSTAGWGSAMQTNTNGYLDVIIQVSLSVANTAPALNKRFYIFAYGGIDSADLGNTGATTGNYPGTEGALTFPSAVTPNLISGLPLIGSIPHAGGVASDFKKRTFSVASVFGGTLPLYWGVAILNNSGAAINATSNSVSYIGVSYV